MPPTQWPYNVFGVWYYPIPSALGFIEEGRASWYGPGFHGKQTSNGESYDMHALTAAHKTLPLGTLVKVARTDNGKSVVVRLNDRGPFVAGRIIDLSYSAAHALDMVGSGTAPVRIEALQRATETKYDGQSVWTSEPIPDFRSGTFTIPVGVYAAPLDAVMIQTSLGNEGHDVSILQVDTPGGVRYRVCVGIFNDLIEAHISAAHLRETGYTQACVITLDQD
jgi:rare lipoprotein A